MQFKVTRIKLLITLLVIPFFLQAQGSFWDVVGGPDSDVILISTTPTINGAPIENGDWIGVFYQDACGLHCGGQIQWTGGSNSAVVAQGDDNLTTPFLKDGFTYNESYQWKLHDASANLTYDATPIYLAGGNYLPGGIGNTFVLALTAVDPPTANATLRGRITTLPIGGTPISGVTVTFSNSGGAVTSDVNGYYCQQLPHGWTGTATPTKTDYTFVPPSRIYSTIQNFPQGQNYVGTSSGGTTYTISGTVTDGTNPLASLEVQFSGETSVFTNASGVYTKTVNAGYSGTSTVIATCYNFTPPTYTYTNVQANFTNQNFTGALKTYTISGTITDGVNPLAGVTVQFTGTTSVVTNASGVYTKTVNCGYSGTATPVLTCYSFTPPTRTYTIVTANQTNQDYTGTLNQITITGTITAGGNPLQFVEVQFTGTSSVLTNASGFYTKTVNCGYTGIATPVLACYTFAPPTRSYTNVTSAQTGQDYTGTLQGPYTISGTITEGAVPLSAVEVQFTGGQASVFTDAAGFYTKNVPCGYSGTATPVKAGYNFTPPNRVYSSVQANQTNQNYSASVLGPYTISGAITIGSNPLQNVEVVFTGLGSAYTNASGFYSQLVPYNYSGTATPALQCYSFAPPSITYTNVIANIPGQNYTATLLGPYAISGTITDGVTPIANVSVAFSGIGTVITNASGVYTSNVPCGWTGTVTPASQCYTFAPVSNTYTNVTGVQINQNFTGTLLGPFTISGHITSIGTGVGIYNVEVTFGALGSTFTDAAGYYAFAVPCGWSGTATPELLTWAFNPASKNYTNVTGNITGEDYIGTQETFMVSGYITTGKGGVAGVSVVFSSGAGSTVTSSTGYYEHAVYSGFIGTATPYKEGYWFDPPSRSYANLQEDMTNQDYIANTGGLPPGWDFTITGSSHIISIPLGVNPTINGVPLAPSDYIGVFYHRGGVDVCGGAVQWNSVAGVVLVAYGDDPTTPLKDGFTEEEAFQWKVYSWEAEDTYDAVVTYDPAFPPTDGKFHANGLSALLSLNATGVTYTISGTITKNGVGLAGAVVAFDDAGGFAYTNAAGFYTHTLIKNWDGTATPAKLGHHFTPVNRTYPPLTSNQINQNYTAELNTYYISGVITDAGTGDPIPGVTVFFSNGGGTTTTLSGGDYSIGVLYGWSGTAVPSKDGYFFDPYQRTYANVAHDAPDQNYLGTYFPLPPGWGFVQTPTTHIILIPLGAMPNINDVPLLPGDYIGVFYHRAGVDVCGGAVLWNGSAPVALVAYGDDPTTTEIKDGFTEGENFQWKVYSEYAGETDDAVVTYDPTPPLSSDGKFHADGLSALMSLDATSTTMFTISGTIIDQDGDPLPGVLVTLDNGGGTDITDAAGFYSVDVLFGWIGTATPYKLRYLFAPVELTYYQVMEDFAGENYVGTFELIPPGWDVTITGTSHIIAIPVLGTNPRIDGVPLEAGDFIGVFFFEPGSDPFSGTEICGGYAEWNGITSVAVIAYGDDQTTPAKDGFETAEFFRWKVFCWSDYLEYEAIAVYDPTFPRWDGKFYPDGLSRLLDLYADPLEVLATATPSFICYNTSTQLNAAATGGSGFYTYSWTPVEHLSNPNIANPVASNLTATTVFTVVVHTFVNVATDDVTVTVYGEFLASIAANQTICYNTAPALLTSTVSGGQGNYTYKWQRLIGSVWTDISLATNPTYQPGPLTATTQYRLQVTDFCGVIITNVVTITVHNEFLASIAANQTICYNTVPALLTSTVSGGQGNYTYKWQVLIGSVWTDINLATNPTYQPGPLTATTQYRFQVTDFCGVIITNVVTITVHNQFLASIAANQTICYNTVPALLTSTVSGGQGNYTYKWQVLIGSVWTDISLATNPTYQPGPLTATTQYRLQVTDFCGVIITNVVTITVNPLPIVNTVSLQASEGSAGPPWTYPVSGTLASGYAMCIDPGITFYYLDINTLTSTPALQSGILNPFKLSQTSLPPSWLSYWAAKGVIAGASGWQGVMWQIINGNQPIFYIYLNGTTSDYLLVDGLTYLTGGGLAPLRVSGDYPEWLYTYTGNVTDVNGCISLPMNVNMKFNTVPVPTITGPDPVCAGSTETYTTEPGMTGYTWFVTGGTGTSLTNSISVVWGAGGTGSVSVNYTDPDGCTAASATIKTITVYYEFTATIAANQTICYNTVPALLTSTVSGGQGNYTYKWQVLIGSVWTDISLATNPTYQPGALLVTTEYRLVVTDYCDVIETNSVTITVNPLPIVNTVSLQASEGSAGPPWTYPVSGTLASGYAMCIDPGITFYYLDINTLTSTPALQSGILNPFTLSQTSLPPSWLSYWAAKGVVAGASGWQGVMWQIINGNQPIFYIYFNGTTSDYLLVDGLTYLTGGGLAPLRVSGDYPEWLYTYTGNVTDVNGCISLPMNVNMKFNTVPVPTITGPDPVCAGSTETYITEPGMSGYTWFVTGGTGTSVTNSISVVWGAGGTGSVSVNYTDPDGCTAASATIKTITIYYELTATIEADQTICYNTVPELLTSTVSGGQGDYTYQWQILEGGGEVDDVFVDIEGATNPTYQPGALLVTTEYRLVVTDFCGVIETNVVTITVYEELIATIAEDQTICYNTVPAELTSTVSGGNGEYLYHWAQSADGIEWEVITGAHSPTYQPPALIETTYYRLYVDDTYNCGPIITNTVIITVYDEFLASIEADQTICYNTVPELLTSTVSGGQGDYEYQWQVLEGGGEVDDVFVDIEGATDPTYQPDALLVTTEYRLIVTDYCGVIETNSVTITVYDEFLASIEADQSICYNTVPELLTSSVSGGQGEYEYQWQYRLPGETEIAEYCYSLVDFTGGEYSNSYDELGWTDNIVPSEENVVIEGVTLNIGELWVDSWYDEETLLLKSPAGTTVTVWTPTQSGSVFDFVFTTDVFNGENTEGTWVLYFDDSYGDGGGKAYDVTLCLSYTISSGEITDWADIEGATEPTYQPDALMVTTEYRLFVIDFCGEIYTEPIVITVYDPLAVTIAADQLSCYLTAPELLTSEATGGYGNYQYQWQTFDGEGWTDIEDATESTYQPATLIGTTLYRLILTDFCGEVISNEVTITIIPLPTADAGEDALICENEYYVLQGTATYYSSVLWSTSGDGEFDDATLLNATYFPGSDDIGEGFVNLSLTAYALEPCTDIATDVMTIEFGPLPIVNAGSDATICENESFQTMGWTSNAWTTLWTTDGDGYFDNPISMAAVYYPGDGDLEAGSVTLILSATSIPPCEVIESDEVIVTFEYQPTANAGPDATICANETYTLNGTASNYSSITWTTAGDGSFSNIHILHPVYTPGANDKQNGSVVLTLTAVAIAPCASNATDSMILHITLQPTANAGPNAPVCEASNYMLSGASASNYSSVLWTTSGTGTFTNPGIVNATYVPSNGDIYNGTVTLTLTAISISPCTGNITDNMVLTIVKKPTANAGPDAITCATAPFTLDGQAANYASVKWTTTGDGVFNNSNILNAIYTPGANDVVNGTVTLKLTAYATVPCNENAVDQMVLTVIKLPTANAGQDSKICEEETYTLEGAATNYDQILWISSGDGGFNNNTILDAIYSPGPLDIFNGYCVLTLTAYPFEPCMGQATDAMTLSIDRIPDQPGMPSGDDIVCVETGTAASVYVTTGSPSALSYSWDIYPANAGTIEGSGSEATVFWSGDYFGPVFIKVAGINDCGTGGFSEIFVVIADDCTGLPDDPSNMVSMKVFPNPSDGRFTMTISGVGNNIDLYLVGYAGQILLQDRIQRGNGDYSKEFDLSTYPKGVYFLKVVGENVLKIQKIVIR